MQATRFTETATGIMKIYQRQALDGRWWWVIDTTITALCGKFKTKKFAQITLDIYLKGQK